MILGDSVLFPVSPSMLRSVFSDIPVPGGGCMIFAMLLIFSLLILMLLRMRLKLKRGSAAESNLRSALSGMEGTLKKFGIEREWLIGEINHRVKNNLQVISSLLSNQSAFLTSEDAIRTISNTQRRLYTISLAYHKFYQAEHLTKIDLRKYVSELLNYLKDEYETDEGIHFEVAITDVQLGINIVVPLGLIIYEVVSNSVKFAFPENKSGKIKIGLDHADAGNLLLSISDNGIGLPTDFDADGSATLGTSLIKGLGRQLGGECKLQDEQGVSLTLKFAYIYPSTVNRYIRDI